MSLLDLAAAFMKELNAFCRSPESRSPECAERIASLKRRVAHLQIKLAKAENEISGRLNDLESVQQDSNDVTVIRRDGQVVAIVSKNIQKPVIYPTDRPERICACESIALGPYSPISSVGIVEDVEELNRICGVAKQACVLVLDHTYRSYTGFCCWLVLLLQDGQMFLIDAIKLRSALSNSPLFTCAVKKILHCRECVSRLEKDFGSVSCYVNYNVTESPCYIDWRIRPMNDVMLTLIKEEMEKVMEKVNLGYYAEHYVTEYVDNVAAFAEEYEIPVGCPVLPAMLNLRNHLAETYDEGVEYVVPSTALAAIIKAKPRSVKEFGALFTRISPVLRLYVGDFLLILKKMQAEERAAAESKNAELVYEDEYECRYRCFDASADGSFGG